MSAAAVEILLVEPQPDTARRVQQALLDAKIGNRTALVDVSDALAGIHAARVLAGSSTSALLLIGPSVDNTSAMALAAAAIRARVPVFSLAISTSGALTARSWSTHEARAVAIENVAEQATDLALVITVGPPERAVREPRAGPTMVMHRTRPLVLAVDDDPLFRTTVAASLVEEGFDVEQAGDGTTALALAQQRLPDVILLDLALPGRSGLEVLHALKDAQPTREIPVLIISAYALVGLAKDLDSADGVLAKPFYLEDLLERVRQVLTSSRAAVRGGAPFRQLAARASQAAWR